MRQLLFFPIFLLIFCSTSCSSPGKKQGRDDDIALAQIISRRPKIIIDAGHGGKDSGTISTKSPSYQEKALNLTTALYLENFLKKMGYQTILTRGQDHFVPLELRASFANSNRGTLFVSIHYNSAPSLKAEGVEVYYYKAEDNKDRTNASKHLAETVLDQVVQGTQCKSRGVKQGNFAVIRETTMPAILIEGGFLTNENERNKILSSGYMKTMASSIAQGINRYLKQSY